MLFVRMEIGESMFITFVEIGFEVKLCVNPTEFFVRFKQDIDQRKHIFFYQFFFEKDCYVSCYSLH